MSTQIREQFVDENWGWMAARGVLVALLGLTVLVWPGPSLASLIVLFGTILLVDGVAALVYAASGGRSAKGNAWPLVLAGIAGVAGAVISYVWPEITAGTILLIIAFWAIARGVLEIVAYVELRNTLRSSWLLALSGTLALIFGLVLLVWPVAGLQVLAWIVGVYAILAGAVFLGLALRMRQALHSDEHDTPHHPTRSPGEPTPA